MIVKIFNAYLNLILNSNPGAVWRGFRTALNWITLPIKLLVIGLLGLFGIAYNRLAYTKRQPDARNLTVDQKKARLKKIFKTMPVLKNESFDLYLPRNRMKDPINGACHSTDHQLLRQGQYVFLMSKLGKRTAQMDTALARFIQQRHLLRGYKWDYEKSQFVDNKRSVSGEMLLGLCLGLLDAPQAKLDPNLVELAGEGGMLVPPTSADFLLEKFDLLVSSIIDNDYALLEGQEPTDEPYKTMWQQRLKLADMREEKVQMKSSRAMWQPGLETVGAQALTILTALKLNAKKNKSKNSDKEYWSLFYGQGYSLLALLPTAYLPNRRGYFNDANCITALHILLKLADTKIEKIVYKFALRYVFNLSKSWYNPYFTGLVKEVAPDLVSEKYLSHVLEYVYEDDPIIWTEDGGVSVQNKQAPAPLALQKHSEFAYGDKMDTYAKPGTGERMFTGLSELASMVLNEPELEKLK